jgi:nucleotide-binding universal stress UspA family protein
MAREIRRVLLPTDFSECSAAAGELGLTLAKACGASVLLLHVIQMPDWGHPDLAGWVEMQARLAKAAETAMAPLAAQARAAGLEVEWLVTDGEPAAAIGRTVTEKRVDLVVMGTAGRKGVQRLLIGSVADKVVRTVPCPVTLVRVPG